MKSEIKKFVTGLGLTPEQIAFVEKNKMSMAILNVVFGKNKSVKFDMVTNFHIFEEVELSRDEQAVFDLFYDFNSTKNGIAVILHSIETGNSITDDTYNQQSKLTPAKELPKVVTFPQFWATLSQEEKTNAVKIATDWLTENHIGETSFDFFTINGTGDAEIKESDYLTGYDETNSMKTYSRVLQASPNGFVTCVNNGSYFTLNRSFRPKVVAREVIPAKVLEILDATFDKLSEESLDQMEYRIEKAMDIANRVAKASGKAFDSINDAKITTIGLWERYMAIYTKNTFTKEESEILLEKLSIAHKTITDGIEAVKVANETKQKEFDRLMALKLTSKDAIAKAVGDANKVKLTKELAEQFKAKVKDATEKLKSEATPKIENATNEPTEANATPKGTRKPKSQTNEPEIK